MGDPLGPDLDEEKSIFRFSEIIFTVKFGPSPGGDDVPGAIDVHFIIEMDMPEKDQGDFSFFD